MPGIDKVPGVFIIMSKRTYKVEVALVQKGFVKVKAQSRREAEDLAKELCGGNLWPIAVHEDDNLVDYNIDRADIFVARKGDKVCRRGNH